MASRLNIAISGGPGSGKSTLGAALFAELKISGFDYDLIGEERRRLKDEMGQYQSPFERIYMWRQQEREELRSNSTNGFVTDTPLFHLYTQARWYTRESRDMLAVRELLRMCLEIKAANRYHIVVVPECPEEVPYRTDQVRTSTEADARPKHKLIRSFVEHFWSDELLMVNGSLRVRIAQITARLAVLQSGAGR